MPAIQLDSANHAVQMIFHTKRGQRLYYHNQLFGELVMDVDEALAFTKSSNLMFALWSQ